MDLTWSAPADVAMLTMKVLKTSAVFEIIFFRSTSFEINPMLKTYFDCKYFEMTHTLRILYYVTNLHF